MSRGVLLASVAAAALLIPASTGAAGERTGKIEKRSLSDGVVDTPLEYDRARDAALRRDARAARRNATLSRKGKPSAKARAAHDQHGTAEGHLPGSSSKVKLIGRLDLTDKADEIADVAGDPRRGFAYLTARGVGEDCATGGKVYVADIRNASKPKLAATIQFPEGRFAGEGAHVIRLKTRTFNGWVLAVNNEECGGFEGDAGMSLYDVTKPTQPKPLAVTVGDKTIGGEPTPFANSVHSVFAWQAGDRAFAMMTDNDEAGVADVDIMEITDPRNPVLVKEFGFPDFPKPVQDQYAHGSTVFVHDFQVKFIDGRWIAYLAYWDAGYLRVDVTDPTNPVFLNASDWLSPDPEFPQFEIGEGNAHQIWVDPTARFAIGTDEDFSPFRTGFSVTEGPAAGQYEAGEFGFTPPIADRPDKLLNGPVTYGGYGCPGTTSAIPAPPTNLPAGQEAILVLQRGPAGDPNAPVSAACFFSEKIEAAQDAGYGGVIVANHHAGSAQGEFPDAAFCGGQGHEFTPTIPAVCMGHRALHLLFGHAEDYTFPYPSGDPGDKEPNIGETGAVVEFTAGSFDGWGYTHLFDAKTMKAIDTYAIEESKDERYASGFGDLSVHEVQFQPGERRNIAWLSYYAGGIRVVKYGSAGLTEAGHYIDEGGNDFWGIDFGRDAAGRTYALGSDRDDGLWIFAYQGG